MGLGCPRMHPGPEDPVHVGLHLPKNSAAGETSPSLAYPLGEAGEAVTQTDKVGGTVGRKEADCGIDVGPGELQAGPHHSQQVRAPGRQRLLQPAADDRREGG